MIPQSWIVNCLKMYKISHEKTMKTCRVELTAGERSVAEIKIQRGIYQGDALSPLLLIIAMIPLNHILRKCTAGYKYLDLARELKKLWSMKVTIVPFVIGAFGTISKGLLKGLEDLEVGGRVETIQMTALLGTARMRRRVLETWGDLLSLQLQWKTIS